MIVSSAEVSLVLQLDAASKSFGYEKSEKPYRASALTFFNSLQRGTRILQISLE